MSVEQFETDVIYNRDELQKLNLKQLYALLPFTKYQLAKLKYTKDNLIEMVLTQFTQNNG